MKIVSKGKNNNNNTCSPALDNNVIALAVSLSSSASVYAPHMPRGVALCTRAYQNCHHSHDYITQSLADRQCRDRTRTRQTTTPQTRTDTATLRHTTADKHMVRVYDLSIDDRCRDGERDGAVGVRVLDRARPQRHARRRIDRHETRFATSTRACILSCA
jgi:hypothetical protein